MHLAYLGSAWKVKKDIRGTEACRMLVVLQINWTWVIPDPFVFTEAEIKSTEVREDWQTVKHLYIQKVSIRQLPSVATESDQRAVMKDFADD